MNIIPKISEEDLENIDIVKTYVSNKVEFQILSNDLLVAFEKIKRILNNLPEIEYAILHVPFSMINISYIHSNLRIEEHFLAFVTEVIKYSLKTDIQFDILFHAGMTYPEFVGINGLEFLEFLCQLVFKTKVGFLLENSIISLNIDSPADSNTTQIFENFDNDKLAFCLDLSHFRSSEYALERDIPLSKKELLKLKNIHFSMARDRDGYKNKSETHGKSHIDFESCLADLNYLTLKGVDINTVNLVVEISESDYKNRPEMKKELEYLRMAEKLGV